MFYYSQVFFFFSRRRRTRSSAWCRPAPASAAEREGGEHGWRRSTTRTRKGLVSSTHRHRPRLPLNPALIRRSSSYRTSLVSEERKGEFLFSETLHAHADMHVPLASALLSSCRPAPRRPPIVTGKASVSGDGPLTVAWIIWP